MAVEAAEVIVEHTQTVGYTIDDDGIWVSCSCGDSRNVGHNPTVGAVIEAYADHVKAVLV